MTELRIRDPLAVRLKALAERKNRSVDDVLYAMLAQYAPDISYTDRPDSFVAMLEMVEAANLEFSNDNIAERSRDILNTEYADYLRQRMQDDNGAG